ncbi:hypothetical protein LTR17_026871 [Elasticomyces elasticus]|nr:hypothetical protein LTR17_026871 [Elasticomyces elasticus]
MHTHASHLSSALLLYLIALLGVPAFAWGYHDNPDQVFSFRSRPEIRAPRWNLTVHNHNLVSPGYWFVAPYERYDDPLNPYGFVGPHIYDNAGDLVWSGCGQFDGAGTMDFRLQNISGVEMLTLLDQHLDKGVVLNHQFEVQQSIDLTRNHFDVNVHELQWVDNNTRVLMFYSASTKAPADLSKTVGFDGECNTIFEGFKEITLINATWVETFRWDSYNHIPLTESTHIGAGNSMEIECRREKGWDYVHLNAVDKDDAGDYYLSARHTNIIYKISGKDRHIIWQLEGLRGRSDFTHHFAFSRQHHVRWRGRNETHSFITILDNALGEDVQPPSHQNSRGLYIALNEQTMVATVEQVYDHPAGSGHFAERRGSFQTLANGNVFMGWSTQAQHSEHTADGGLIMQAALLPEWLGNYRNYKFPFVGRPSTVPDVHSAAYDVGNATTKTLVHVSWNGATEVRSWRLFKTTQKNETTAVITSANRTGFETLLQHDGYASYVYVEALDLNGTVLSRSHIQKTITHPNVTSAALQKETEWLRAATNGKQSEIQRPRIRAWVFFFGGLLAGATLAAVLVPRFTRTLMKSRYEMLRARDTERDGEETESTDSEKSKMGLSGSDDEDECTAATKYDRAYR